MVYVAKEDVPWHRNPGLKTGEIIVVRSGAYTGDSAIVTSEFHGSVAGYDMVLTPLRCDPRFLAYAMLSRYMLDGQIFPARLRAAQPHLNAEELGSFFVALPKLPDQKAISAFLDGETRRIDALVQSHRRVVELLTEEVASLVFSCTKSAGTRELRLGNAATVVLRPVTQKEGELYTPVGLFNRGRGMFHKGQREMRDMGDSDFFWIEEADLIISGQFAWEGAIALAERGDSGCVVSHRYHVLRGRDGIALTEYLLALLATEYGDFLLNENSRGAAGRNRPLNINSLLKEKIPIPSLPAQKMVAKAVHRRIRVLSETAEQIGRLHEYRSALISAAVTGQIDVRTYRPQEAAVLCR
jgi:type I restriction enzyme S subunit